jgi:hypothetical protein
MRNTASVKSLRKKVHADASRAAKTMAKIVAPGIRKSAAKRTEKAVMSASTLKKVETVQKLSDLLTAGIKQDASDVARGVKCPVKTARVFRAMQQAMRDAREEQP